MADRIIAMHPGRSKRQKPGRTRRQRRPLGRVSRRQILPGAGTFMAGAKHTTGQAEPPLIPQKAMRSWHAAHNTHNATFWAQRAAHPARVTPAPYSAFGLPDNE